MYVDIFLVKEIKWYNEEEEDARLACMSVCVCVRVCSVSRGLSEVRPVNEQLRVVI